MKRIVIALIAVLSAAIANAAAVNWTVTGVKSQADSSVNGVGYIAYLFQSETVSTATIGEAIGKGTFGTYTGSALSSYAANNSGVITRTGLGSYGATASNESPEVVKFFTVLFDAGSYSEAEHYIMTPEVTVSFTSSTGVKTAIFQNISASNTWQPVPEPTSGLLLLIGVAGLALRRKRA